MIAAGTLACHAFENAYNVILGLVQSCILGCVVHTVSYEEATDDEVFDLVL